MTDAETILWSRLQDRQLGGYAFLHQHPVGPYIADFACRSAKLVVELDGATHSSLAEKAHDARRAGFLKSRGWTVIRFWNAEVYENLHGVLETILRQLPPPSRA